MAKTFKFLFKPVGLEAFHKTLSKVVDDQKKLTKLTESYNKVIQTQSGLFGGLTNKVALGTSKIGGMLDKIAGGSGKFAKPFKMMQLGMQKSLAGGKGMFASLTAGVQAFGAGATASFGGLIPMVMAFGTALWTALGPIALIAVAIFLIKKAWDNNLGGIQTKFSQVMGILKDAWGKFSVGINKFMKSISSTFKPIINVLFFITKILLKWNIGILIVAFKILGFVIKAALIPLVLLFKAIGWLVGVAKRLIGWFMKLAFVQKYIQKMRDQFAKVKAVVTGIWEKIKPIIDGLRQMAEFLGLIDEKEDGATSAGSNRISPAVRGAGRGASTTNNSNNVTIAASGNIRENDAPRIGAVVNSALVAGTRRG